MTNERLTSISVDVEVMPNGNYDVWIASEGSSGAHYVDVDADKVGENVADLIECLAENVTELKKNKKRKPEINKVMTISTAHISKETEKALSEDNVGVTVFPKGEYGYFVYLTDWQRYGMNDPEDLKQCIQYAQDYGCELLCIDRDAETMEPDLPVYEL